MQSSIQLGKWEIAHDPAYPVTLARQVHGNGIINAASCTHRITEADGIIGTPSDAAFGVHTADCLPLILTTDTRAIALHISRHTLVAGILDTVMEHIKKEPITAAYIGPHICENCFVFEERGEGIAQFETLFPYSTRQSDSGIHLSLRKVVIKFLSDVPSVVEDFRCTLETPELPSYRRWRAEGEIGDFPRIITSVRFTHA